MAHDLAACWKLVSGKSERQYGAFCILYQREYSRPPNVLPEGRVKFRNSVIHQGRIPRKSEVVEYASGVLELIAGLYNELYETRYQGVSRRIGIELGEAKRLAPRGTKIGTMGIATMFSDVTRGKGQTSFAEALTELERRRELMFTR